jgi:hypothetical protein
MVPLTMAALTEFADRTGADPTDEATRVPAWTPSSRMAIGVPAAAQRALLVRIESQEQEVLRTPTL